METPDFGGISKNDPFLIKNRDHFWDPKTLQMSSDLIKNGSKNGSQNRSKMGHFWDPLYLPTTRNRVFDPFLDPFWDPFLGPPRPKTPFLGPKYSRSRPGTPPKMGHFRVPTPIPRGSGPPGDLDPPGSRPPGIPTPGRTGVPQNGSFLGPFLDPLFGPPFYGIGQYWGLGPFKISGTSPDPSKKGSQKGVIFGYPKIPRLVWNTGFLDFPVRFCQNWQFWSKPSKNDQKMTKNHQKSPFFHLFFTYFTFLSHFPL